MLCILKQPPCRQQCPPNLCLILNKHNGRHSTYSSTQNVYLSCLLFAIVFTHFTYIANIILHKLFYIFYQHILMYGTLYHSQHMLQKYILNTMKWRSVVFIHMIHFYQTGNSMCSSTD